MDKKGLAKPRVYQTKIKIYPDGSTVLTVYKNAIVYRGSAEKESDDFDDIEGSSFSNNCVSVLNSEEKQMKKKNMKIKNLWRIKTKIKDYILSNDFNYFWTLTFKADRYDYDLAFQKWGNGCEECVINMGSLIIL